MGKSEANLSTLGRNYSLNSAGQYNPDSSIFSKSPRHGYTISGKHPIKDNNLSPGPGTYNPTQIDKPHAPTTSMGIRTQST